MGRHRFNGGTGSIIRAAIEVHRELGSYFSEYTYQRALAYEFVRGGLEFKREYEIPVFYKGERIHTRKVDFVVGDCLVELKALRKLEAAQFVQTLCYLKASRFRLGLLLNFGGKRFQIKRIVN